MTATFEFNDEDWINNLLESKSTLQGSESLNFKLNSKPFKSLFGDDKFEKEITVKKETPAIDNEMLFFSLNNLDSQSGSSTSNSNSSSLTNSNSSSLTNIASMNSMASLNGLKTKKKRAPRKRLTPHQKQAHNKIEKRYRININTKIANLQKIIPWVSNEKTAFKTGDSASGKDDEEMVPKLNKSMILEKAISYICYLQKNETKMNAKNEFLLKKLQEVDPQFDVAQLKDIEDEIDEQSSPLEFNDEDYLEIPQ